jgi:TonB family protein
VATFLQSPVYPYELSAAGISGRVVVSLVIDATGRVRDVRAVESTHQAFEAAAVAAVSKWQFDPGMKEGRMVNTQVSQALEFSAKPDAAQAGDWF